MVSEIDLAAGLEPCAVMRAFAMSCPIPAHIVGSLNTTKAVEVALSAYRFVVFPVLLCADASLIRRRWCQHMDADASTVLAQRLREAFPHSTVFSE
jgi:hypothetical protein